MFNQLNLVIITMSLAAPTACGQQQAATAETPVIATASQREPSPTPAPASASDAPTPSAHMQSPISAHLQEPPAVPSSGTIDLNLQLTRVQPILVPITIKVVLPTGVALTSGLAAETINDTTVTKFDRSFRLSYAAVPVDDAKVIVDWQTPGAGYHAELPYRFGRSAPVAKEPARLPGEVVLPGGQSLGRPILTNGGKKPDK